MDVLAYKPANQLATRADTHAHSARQRDEIRALRREMYGLSREIRELRGMAERAQSEKNFAEVKRSIERTFIAAGVANFALVIVAIVM